MTTVVTIATLPAVSGAIFGTVDMSLTSLQATKLNQITAGLVADAATMIDGNAPVQTPADALKHLIEQAAAA